MNETSTSKRSGLVQTVLGHHLTAKLAKYAAVSLISVVISQATLYVMASVWDWDAVVANVAAVALGTPTSYVMNRAWVWSKHGKSSFWTEVVPFWVLTFAGLGLSSLIVWIFHELWPDQKILVNVGNIAGFGLLWLLKFFILERLLFKVTGERADEVAAPLL